MSSSRDFFEIAGIFCLTLLLFTWGVSTHEIIGFESRFYLFALEMWRDGMRFFPTSYHEFYPDYPATSTFLIYFVANVMGKMNKLAAVIPSAVAASITMVLTYRIGAIQNKRWGLFAVFFLLFTVMFLKSARSISLDMYTTMVCTWCFYLIYSSDIKQEHSPGLALYFLLLLGFAFRGPIGLVMPAGVICIYYMQDRNFKQFIFAGVFALLLLICSTIFLLTMADQLGGDQFVNDVLRMQVVGRMEKSHLPLYFYFTTGLRDYALSFPLAVLTMLGAMYYEQRLHHHSAELKLLLKLLGWAMVILVGMSIPGDKKIRYVLAMSPAIALMAAFILVAPKKERFFWWLRWILLRAFLILPFILFIGMRIVMSYATKHTIDFHINYLLMTQILFAALAINILIFICAAKKEHWRDIGVMLVATLSFVMSYMMVAEPIEQYIDRTHEFVVEVEAARHHNHAKLVFYKDTRDGLPIKYLINMPAEELPIFIDNEHELTHYAEPAFFVVSEVYYNQLSVVVAAQFRIIAKDMIGHVPVVVFTNR